MVCSSLCDPPQATSSLDSTPAGRKRALLVGDVLFAAGAALMASATSVVTLIAGEIECTPSSSMNLRPDCVAGCTHRDTPAA